MEGNEQKKVVIELQNVKRNFIVGDEVVHACGECRSRFTKGNLSPSWERPVPANLRC